MGHLLLLLVVVLVALASGASASDLRDACSLTSEIIADPEQRGCCSWHGGVCGCSLGRVVCCDGNLSPSCRCKGGGGPEPVPGLTERLSVEPDVLLAGGGLRRVGGVGSDK